MTLLAVFAMMAAAMVPAFAQDTACRFQGAVYRFEAAPGTHVAMLRGVRDVAPGHVAHQPYTADEIKGLLVVLEIGTQTHSPGFESTADNQPECLKRAARAALASILDGRDLPIR